MGGFCLQGNPELSSPMRPPASRGGGSNSAVARDRQVLCQLRLHAHQMGCKSIKAGTVVSVQATHGCGEVPSALR